MSLTDKERWIMQHALGLSNSDNTSRKPYRNRYQAAGYTDPVWEGLCERGLATRTAAEGTRAWYAVTDRGMAVLGAAPLDGLEPSERYP